MSNFTEELTGSGPAGNPILNGASRFKATEAGEWKRAAVQLPASGHWVVLNRVNLRSLLRSGKIPNPLLAMANKILENKQDEGREELTPEAQVEHDESVQRSFDAMVCACVADPVIVMSEEEETDDTVWVGRVLDQDKTWICRLAWEHVETLSRFRGEPGVADGGRDSEALLDPAE